MSTHKKSVDIHEQLSDLRRDIYITKEEEQLISSERSRITRELIKLEIFLQYCYFAKWFRKPTSSFTFWPAGALSCGPTLVGTIFFSVAYNLNYTTSQSLLIGGIGILLSSSLIAIVLFLPKNNSLCTHIQRCRSDLTILEGKHKSVSQKHKEVATQLRYLREDKKRIINSIRYTRELLFRENWKAMRGIEWENFLERVGHALGYTVETTRTSGDQGVDLIYIKGHSRIAVQAKGYVSSVSNSAVQQAVAGMKVYSCNRCAVITNSRFTSAAIELAAANGCTLIGEENLEGFVLGEFSL